MKHDHAAFSLAQAYTDPALVEDRVRRFMPLVNKTAWHLHGSGCPGLDVEDLVQCGFVALTECARRHAGPGEDGFAAYAKIRVRGAMYDLLRRSLPDSRGATDRRKRLDRVTATLRTRLGREPYRQELAAELGIAQADLASYEGVPVRVASLDATYDETDSAFADDRPDAFSILADYQDNEELAAAIADLPEREQMVLQLYFVEEMNLTEIAAVLDVSTPRVHQIKAAALARLRKTLVSDK